ACCRDARRTAKRADRRDRIAPVAGWLAQGKEHTVESLISVPQSELDDLRERIASTRWPLAWPTEPWAAGTDASELRRLANYWVDGYDWRAQEAQINALPSYIAEPEGQKIHFLRFDAESPDAA